MRKIITLAAGLVFGYLLGAVLAYGFLSGSGNYSFASTAESVLGSIGAAAGFALAWFTLDVRARRARQPFDARHRNKS